MEKYNKLQILTINKDKATCLCDCGKTTIKNKYKVFSGHTKSCGCLLKQTCINRNTKHGLSETIEYRTWAHMKTRIFNTHSYDYKNYGGRGLQMDSTWVNNFGTFLQDVGKKPRGKYSIERINNDIGYIKGNCKWATAKEQALNKRNTIRIKYKNKHYLLQDLAAKFNLSSSTLYQRLFVYKWTINKALLTGLHKNKIYFRKHNKSNNKSGCIGVHWRKERKRWIATIKINKHKYNLGSYIAFNDAVIARKMAEYDFNTA